MLSSRDANIGLRSQATASVLFNGLIGPGADLGTGAGHGP